MATVLRAKTAGFCMGVGLALRKLDQALKEHRARSSGRLVMLGPIIHNPQVMNTYMQQALRTVTNRPEGTFRSLRYYFGGDHPSQTTHQTVSSQLRVRTQIIKGPYFNSDSTNTGVPASKSPAYPTHQLPKFNVKL